MTGVPVGGATRASLRAFERFGWATLGITILVIVWGAVVRATGSGAGCGDHWPLCNGDIVPLDPTVQTVIEFVHRVTSGAVMLMSLALWLWARRVFSTDHPARRWARISFIFMLIEAAIGAGIVLLRLVEDNASALRAGYVGGHLVNTLLLVGATLSTLWWARPDRPVRSLGSMLSPVARPFTLCLLALLAVASTGAIVALGDTLFPHTSLAEGFAADLDPTSHFLIRLRIWHPVFAALTALALVRLAARADVASHNKRAVVGTVVLQIVLGIVNLLLLAPLWLQMAHLVISNLLWMAVVWTWLDVRAARGQHVA